MELCKKEEDMRLNCALSIFWGRPLNWVSVSQVIRNRREIFEGQLASLRRVKESVNEISYGNECGVGVTGFIDWRQGDKIQAFEVQSKRQTLEEASDRKVYGDFSTPQYTQV